MTALQVTVNRLRGYWPQSQECNDLLHFDWRNNQYYSDFYGENEFVQLVCTKDEYIKCRENL